MTSIAGELERVLGSTERREELIALGREQSRQFSWARCAELIVTELTRAARD